MPNLNVQTRKFANFQKVMLLAATEPLALLS